MSDKGTAIDIGTQQLCQKISKCMPAMNRKVLAAWLECPPDILAKQLLDVFFYTPYISRRIIFSDRITIKEKGGSFSADEHFLLNTDIGAKVRISYIGEEFYAKYRVKTEKVPQLRTLRGGKLAVPLNALEVINEFGGEIYAETFLSEVFFLVKGQPRGEKNGPLLVDDGFGNIFFVRNIFGELSVLLVMWCRDGWGFIVRPVNSVDKWRDCNKVFGCTACI